MRSPFAASRFKFVAHRRIVEREKLGQNGDDCAIARMQSELIGNGACSIVRQTTSTLNPAVPRLARESCLDIEVERIVRGGSRKTDAQRLLLEGQRLAGGVRLVPSSFIAAGSAAHFPC